MTGYLASEDVGDRIMSIGVPSHFLGISLVLINAPAAAAAAKSLQSCPTLCDPIDGSPPGSPVPGIIQARTLEWVAISFSNAWKWKVKVKSLSRVWLLATPWTTAYQAPPSMGFSRQEYWSGVPLPSPNKCPYPILYVGSIFDHHINYVCWVIAAPIFLLITDISWNYTWLLISTG